MAKVSLSDITSRGIAAINSNFQTISDYINNNLLSRDTGAEANQMLNDLDMNSNDILNVDVLHADSLMINGTPVIVGGDFGTASAANISYNQGDDDAVVTSVQAKLREFVSVKDFGAIGDGSTDDTAAIQAAIDSGAKNIHIPSGSYKISQITISDDGLCLSGDGYRATELLCSSETLDGVVVGDNDSVIIYGVTVRDMSLSVVSGVEKTTGAHLLVANARNITITDVKLVNPYYGIHLNGAYKVRIDNILVQDDYARTSSGHSGIYATYNFDATGYQVKISDVRVSNLLVGCDVNYGIYLNNADFFSIDQAHINVAQNACIQLDPAAPGLDKVFITNSYMDSAVNYHIRIGSTTGPISDISVVNCLFTCSTNVAEYASFKNNISIADGRTGATSNLRFDSNTFKHATEESIRIIPTTNPNYVSITNNYFDKDTTSNSAYNIVNVDCETLVCSGNVFDDTNSGITSTTIPAIKNAGTGTIIMTDNDFSNLSYARITNTPEGSALIASSNASSADSLAHLEIAHNEVVTFKLPAAYGYVRVISSDATAGGLASYSSNSSEAGASCVSLGGGANFAVATGPLTGVLADSSFTISVDTTTDTLYVESDRGAGYKYSIEFF